MMKEKSSSMHKEEEGTVFFIKTSKGLFPIDALKKAEIKPTSQQLKEKKWVTEHGLMPHPFDTSGFLFLQDNCSYFDACIRQIAQDVVGQGWEIKAREGVKNPNEEQRKTIKEFLLDPNETDEDISDIIEQVIIDWGLVGWWGIEVERDKDEIIGLWHVPAHTLKVHRDKKKYCQIRNVERIWFRAFRSDEQISRKTGNPIKGRKDLAHELIYFKRYYPKSDYYGVPAILPAVASVYGLIGIRDFNLAFFENYGVPAALVILKGKWSAEAAKQITNFLDVEIKGSSNAHKTLVLKPPATGDVTFEPLITKIEEGGFKLYLKILRDEVLSTYKMPPYRIGIAEMGSLGGSTAVESTRIYASSIVAPLKRVSGRIISNKIIRDGLDIKDFMFEWNELDTRDMEALVKRLQLLFMMASVTPNQIRRQMGWEERKDPEANQYYLAANFLPVGEELVEKRDAIQIASLEELAAKLDQAIEETKALKINREEE